MNLLCAEYLSFFGLTHKYGNNRVFCCLCNSRYVFCKVPWCVIMAISPFVFMELASSRSGFLKAGDVKDHLSAKFLATALCCTTFGSANITSNDKDIKRGICFTNSLLA